jgi:hypothetical protein
MFLEEILPPVPIFEPAWKICSLFRTFVILRGGDAIFLVLVVGLDIITDKLPD